MCMDKAWHALHKLHPGAFPQFRAMSESSRELSVLDATEEALALTVPCPLTACSAFCGERCVSYATGRALDTPHPKRVEEARKYASGNTGAL